MFMTGCMSWRRVRLRIEKGYAIQLETCGNTRLNDFKFLDEFCPDFLLCLQAIRTSHKRRQLVPEGEDQLLEHT